jgi:hypothetical protein
MKSDMQLKPDILPEPGKPCESWQLPASKKQGKPMYLWEPWKRSKPLEPGEPIEVGDAVEAEDVVRSVELIKYMEAGEVGGAVGEVKVIGIVAAGARNPNVAMALAAEILAKIQI